MATIEHNGDCYCPQPEVNEETKKCKLCGGTNPKIVEQKKKKRTRRQK